MKTKRTTNLPCIICGKEFHTKFYYSGFGLTDYRHKVIKSVTCGSFICWFKYKYLLYKIRNYDED